MLHSCVSAFAHSASVMVLGYLKKKKLHVITLGTYVQQGYAFGHVGLCIDSVLVAKKLAV